MNLSMRSSDKACGYKRVCEELTLNPKGDGRHRAKHGVDCLVRIF